MITKPPLVLLAGGENHRFFPLNTGTHKGCRVVAGKPLLVWALEDVCRLGFTRVILVVSSKDFNNQGISAELSNYNLPLEIEYVLQPEAKGQADAILLGTKSVQEDCIVASPYYLNLGELAAQLAEAATTSTAECILLGSHTDHPEHFGILSIEVNKVTGLIEKPDNPASDKKTNSVYFLRKSFIEYLATQPEAQYSLEASINTYAQDHLIEWQEIGELPSLKFSWHLLDFMRLLLKKQAGFISPSAIVAQTAVLDDSTGAIVIEENARINDFVKIVGPAYVGKNVTIGDYSFIRQSAIEQNTIVGARTEIVRSLLESKVSIHGSYCADSIIGAGTKISSGLNTANKRLDRANIHVHVHEKKINAGRNNLGVIIGESSNIGISVNTMPGVLIGTNSSIYPGITLFKNVQPKEIIKNQSR